MDEITCQLQLNIIDNLLQDVTTAHTKSAYFEKALQGLSELIDTSLLVYTYVNKDINNNSYLLTHTFYSPNNKTSYVKNTFTRYIEADRPALIKRLYAQGGELIVKQSEFMRNLLWDAYAKESKDNHQQDLVLVPFFDSDSLTGILAYRGGELFQIKERFPALFNTLNTNFRNIRRNKEAQLQLSTYQNVLDLIPQRVFWKNRDSVYLGCNQAFADDASLGSTEEIMGLTDFEVFPQEAELYRRDDAHTMKTLEHIISSEEPQTHKNGETIWLRTSKRPIMDDDTVVGVVGTYDDITQLKDIQHELEESKSTLEKRVMERTKALSASHAKLENVIAKLQTTQTQLVESEKMASLGGLVAGLAHEINTPLGVAITGASHLEHIARSLNDSVESGKISKTQFKTKCLDLVHSSEIILRNLNRASDLVKSFKMVAVDQSQDKKRTLNVYNFIADVIKGLTPQASHKNIRILLQGDKKLKIHTYPGAISQLITNMVDNAYMHAFSDIYAGEIKISYKCKENNLELNIQDNGKGMSEEVRQSIFEPFYTTKRGEGGTGLGLSIVYNLVTHTLQGSIACHSKEDELTRFYIQIPLKKP